MTSWKHQESGESEFKLLKAKLALRFVPLQQLCFERRGWIQPPSTPTWLTFVRRDRWPSRSILARRSSAPPTCCVATTACGCLFWGQGKVVGALRKGRFNMISEYEWFMNDHESWKCSDTLVEHVRVQTQVSVWLYDWVAWEFLNLGELILIDRDWLRWNCHHGFGLLREAVLLESCKFAQLQATHSLTHEGVVCSSWLTCIQMYSVSCFCQALGASLSSGLMQTLEGRSGVGWTCAMVGHWSSAQVNLQEMCATLADFLHFCSLKSWENFDAGLVRCVP